MTEESRYLATELAPMGTENRLDNAWKSDVLEADDVPLYYKRRSAGVWTGLASVMVALVAACTYGYSILRQQNIQLESIPALMKSLPELNYHIVNVANLLTSTRADQQNLEAQVLKVDAGTSAALGQTQKQMGVLVNHMQQSLLSGMSQSNGDLQAQISQLAGQQDAYQRQLSQVQSDLEQTRLELASAQKEYSEALDVIREEQSSVHRELTSLSGSLPTRQVNFEIRKNQAADIAPGVSFRLTRIDAGHQRFDGWIESGAAHQKVWVQNQEARSPVMFFPTDQGKAFLMVPTRVKSQSVSGYFLVPTRGDVTDRAHLVSSTSNTQLSETAERENASTLEQ
jgi:flagellar biosynthesis chaperone FliJ